MTMWKLGPATAIVLMAACKPAPDGPPGHPSEPVGTKIACAVGGSGEFTNSCDVERASEDETVYLVVRHPDGGFRRFELLRDGRGLASADGADEAQITLRDKEIEVAVGADRYRFPAIQTADVGSP